MLKILAISPGYSWHFLKNSAWGPSGIDLGSCASAILQLKPSAAKAEVSCRVAYGIWVVLRSKCEEGMYKMAAKNVITALSGRNPSNLITEELLGKVQLRNKRNMKRRMHLFEERR